MHERSPHLSSPTPSSPPPATLGSTCARRRRPALEALEPRAMLSVALGVPGAVAPTNPPAAVIAQLQPLAMTT